LLGYTYLLFSSLSSALDTSTEKDIQKALQNLVKGRSSVSIAHRLSTIASADLILVLNSGQIVEQGTHKELLARDGIFASMWADQVSSTEDPAISLHSSVKKETSTMFSNDTEAFGPVAPAAQEDAAFPFDVEPVAAAVQTPDNITEHQTGDDVAALPDLGAISVTEKAPDLATEASVTDGPTQTETPDTMPVLAFPSLEPADEPTSSEPLKEEPPAPVAVASSAPVAFPTSASDEPESQTRVEPSAPVGVTFGETVNTPPRSGTPGPDPEPKRGGQFQRLARRISLTTRRQGSSSSLSMIPGLKRDNSGKQSEEGSAKGEGSGQNGSPAASLAGDDKLKKNKKDKKDKKDKEKRRKSLM